MTGDNVAFYGKPHGKGIEGVSYIMGVRIGSEESKLNVCEYFDKFVAPKVFE